MRIMRQLLFFIYVGKRNKNRTKNTHCEPNQIHRPIYCITHCFERSASCECVCVCVYLSNTAKIKSEYQGSIRSLILAWSPINWNISQGMGLGCTIILLYIRWESWWLPFYSTMVYNHGIIFLLSFHLLLYEQ